jgi:hypothetical protein
MFTALAGAVGLGYCILGGSATTLAFVSDFKHPPFQPFVFFFN